MVFIVWGTRGVCFGGGMESFSKTTMNGIEK